MKTGDIAFDYSEELSELLQNPPSFIVRGGTFCLTISFALLFGLTYLMPFPVKVSLEGTLSSNETVAHVISQTSGKLFEIGVTDGQLVKKGEFLAVIGSNVLYSDIQHIQTWLNADVLPNMFEKRHISITEISPPKLASQGEVQPYLIGLLEAIAQYNNYIQNDPVGMKINHLKSEINRSKAVRILKSKKKSIALDALALAEMRVKRVVQQYDDHMATVIEKEMIEGELIAIRQDLNNTQAELLILQGKSESLHEEVVELNLQRKVAKEMLKEAVILNGTSLAKGISSWLAKYAFHSPIDGQVHFYKFSSKYQFVQSGDEVFTIVPEVRHHRVVSFIDSRDMRKVRLNQRALFSLDRYPVFEYGHLEGTVSYVSSIAQNGLRKIYVDLPRDLVTTQNRQVTYVQDAPGKLVLITEERQLIERFFDRFISALSYMN